MFEENALGLQNLGFKCWQCCVIHSLSKVKKTPTVEAEIIKDTQNKKDSATVLQLHVNEIKTCLNPSLTDFHEGNGKALLSNPRDCPFPFIHIKNPP